MSDNKKTYTSVVDMLRDVASPCEHCGASLADALKERIELKHVRAQRDAWREVARRMYDVFGSGGRRGRPMDLVRKSEWQWIVKAIADATALDDAELAREADPCAKTE